jgi:ribose/xylose/arabinose/galactoside ABC-type transport system permease subunit
VTPTEIRRTSTDDFVTWRGAGLVLAPLDSQALVVPVINTTKAAIPAVVIGGATLGGSSGSILGSIVGAPILAVGMDRFRQAGNP